MYAFFYIKFRQSISSDNKLPSFYLNLWILKKIKLPKYNFISLYPRRSLMIPN